jgi:hypothetical protein
MKQNLCQAHKYSHVSHQIIEIVTFAYFGTKGKARHSANANAWIICIYKLMEGML